MEPTRTCSTPDCGQKIVLRGMCRSCYNRAYRTGAIEVTPKVDVHSLSNVDVWARTATCSICGPTMIRVRSGARGHQCMTVRRAERQRFKRAISPSRRRERVYSLSPESYAKMWLAQDGCCAICKKDAGRLVVDHSHETGDVRGLLCDRCNVALGWMEDEPSRLRNAAAYLEAS